MRRLTRGNTSARGYGNEHQRLKQWAPHVERGDVKCARCHRWIAPKGYPCPKCGKRSCRWDLDHADKNRSVYLGPSHTCCNRATAGRPGRSQQREGYFSPPHWSPPRNSREW
jgi:hypothetical protein